MQIKLRKANDYRLKQTWQCQSSRSKSPQLSVSGCTSDNRVFFNCSRMLSIPTSSSCQARAVDSSCSSCSVSCESASSHSLSMSASSAAIDCWASESAFCFTLSPTDRRLSYIGDDDAKFRRADYVHTDVISVCTARPVILNINDFQTVCQLRVQIIF